VANIAYSSGAPGCNPCGVGVRVAHVCFNFYAPAILLPFWYR